MLKTPIPWQMLPKEMGCGSGMTCWRRLEEWHEAGVWDRLRKTPLLDRLGRADEIDWERASLDSASVTAPGGPKDRSESNGYQGKSGSKRHVMVDRRGVPLAVIHTAANVHDSKVLEELVDTVAPIRKSLAGADRASARRSCMPTRPTTTSNAVERRSGREA